MTNDVDIIVLKNLINLILKIEHNIFDKEFKYLFVSISRSFLFKQTDDEIFNIITNNLYYTTELYKKCRSISYNISKMSIYNLLETIVNEFDYYNKIITIGNMDDSLVKLNKLFNISENLAEIDYSIYDFAKYLNELIVNGYDMTYNTGSEIGDCVTIMTIHKSKGLEYHICYYANLYKEFNIRDLKERFLFDKKYGIIVPYFNEGIGETIYKELLKQDYLAIEISEKIRLFYVALTRAKEKMIFINYDDEKEQQLSEKISYRSFKNILDSIKNVLNPFIIKININDLELSKDYNIIKSTNYKDYLKKTNDKFIVREFSLDNSLINEKTFSKKTNKLFSKDIIKNMKYGEYIHYIFEIANFKDIELSPLDDNYKNLVKNFLKHDIFSKILSAKIYKEYEFIYEENSDLYHGIIDLMLEYDNYIDIIDYKIKDITDENYYKQLKGYKEYIENNTNKSVNIYLYSILDDKLKQLNKEEK